MLAEDGSQRNVGFVRTIDKHSRMRVQRAITEQGGPRDGLMVFTDGDTRLRDLQMSVLPDAVHVLDWYLLTRRLTVLAMSSVARMRLSNCRGAIMTGSQSVSNRSSGACGMAVPLKLSPDWIAC